MKVPVSFFVSFLMLLPSLSWAYCKSAKALFEAQMHCEDNGKYIQHAMECQKRFRSDIGLFAQALKLSLSGKTGDQQNQNLLASLDDYRFSTGQLDFLILLAEKAKADILSYKNWVVQPEDIDNPDIAPDPEAFARSVPCYQETLKAVDAIAKNIESMKGDLQKARASAEAAGRIAAFQAEQLKNSGTINLDSFLGSSERESGPPQSTPRKTNEPHESDVTGQKNLRPSKP